ncbi:tRNA selenocysteine 1 associated protein 1 [Echinococcus multilocularis]|uniref:tRNA selenocysteine-associated protein 1 n=1 Tax=Echinococcus multilocularis TaxID=6211 RepID=A0A068Y739_ECHMU|nr:tRNA selenocysteine 1 associated protein 1 [Echinococcus multilocularis]
MQNFSHTIWMGDLEPFMDETFIRQAFEFHDEKVVSVKIIRNKATGQTLGYGFVEFLDGIAARDAMLKLNGKPIPGIPTRRFKLNHASYGKDSSAGEFSLFVGELTEDVDDLILFNAFKKYPSCRSAKVVMNNGKSRGYGFVRFASEADQDRALIEMQNYSGLGYKPIRVSLAIPKRYTADGQLIQAAKDEQAAAASSSSLLPSGMPDPFTAAVAAAVSGSSQAQAEYYQAYQQYYQQYYAAHFAHYSYAGGGAGGGVGGEGAGEQSIAAAAATLASSYDGVFAAAAAAANGAEDPLYEHTPEPSSLSAAYDRPRHVQDIDECFSFLEASRWDFTSPDLPLLISSVPY